MSGVEPEQTRAKVTSDKTGTSGHVAHAEGWLAIATVPDFCKVGSAVVAFNSFATLDQKFVASPNVKARGTSVFRASDLIANIRADAGKHVVSGTSLNTGHVKLLDGHKTVKVNGLPVARHDTRCLINCDESGNGGAQGKIVTEARTSRPPQMVSDTASRGIAERTSPRLEALTAVRNKLAAGSLNLDALDEYVNFKQASESLGETIEEMTRAPGLGSDFSAQVTRASLSFVKDVVLGTGEIAYEGMKAVPKLARATLTPRGKALAQLDARILAENIKLGNVSVDKLRQNAVDFGMAAISSVTDPWNKGNYVESITRGILEAGTLGLPAVKGRVLTTPLRRTVPPPSATDGVFVSGARAALIAARRKIAEDFYRKSGMPEHKIHGHVAGIDLTKPVDVVVIEKDVLLTQYQVPGAAQGSYYARSGDVVAPDALGISKTSLDPLTGKIVDRTPATFRTTQQVEMLSSTAARITDTWSVPGTSIPTSGGAKQLFSSDSIHIVPSPGE